jgi:hypothetical protein
MKKGNKIIRKTFQYDFGKKRSTIVEFDIVGEGKRKVPKNITLTSNWRAHYPNNPQITSNPQGEFGFSGDGVIITNGDIQQMIKRIFQIISEIED